MCVYLVYTLYPKGSNMKRVDSGDTLKSLHGNKPLTFPLKFSFERALEKRGP